MMAIGVDRADPPGHRRRGVGSAGHGRGDRRRDRAAAPEPYDLILFGNESADAGNYQVAIRVAHALGLPCVNGIKAITVDGGRLRCEQEVGRRRDVYVVPLPAVVTRQGGDQPAALPVGARAPAGQAQAARRHSTPARPDPAGDDAAAAARRAGQADRGARPRTRGGAGGGRSCATGAGLMTPGLRRGADGRALPAGARRSPRGARAGDVRRGQHRRAPYAPAAWAAALVEAIAERAGRGDRSRERPGQRGAGPCRGALDQPLAANCSSVTPGDPATVIRVRWGGSLLEEALLHGSPLLLTVAPHAVAARAGPPSSRRR